VAAPRAASCSTQTITNFLIFHVISFLLISSLNYDTGPITTYKLSLIFDRLSLLFAVVEKVYFLNGKARQGRPYK
jgi:hypothetical protein